ncbi:hypothetical protein GYA93_18990, partial [Gordonia desulfuricans]|nr:hypothetical protein [Gordonia desulfuricans]NDK91645.1 hypothetical protein [Gordonia desulfuricans]
MTSGMASAQPAGTAGEGGLSWQDLVELQPFTVPVAERYWGDEELDAGDLTEILAHCAATRATAWYRM